MQVLLIYLLKVIACSGLLFGYYWLALRNKQFHQYNRFYLLSAVVLSITLPLLQLEWWTVQSENETAVKLMEVMYLSGNETYTAPTDTSFTWQHAIGLLFLLSFALLAVRLLSRIVTIFRLKKRYPCTSLDSAIQLVETDLPDAPFSFLSNLFWRTDIDLNETTGQQILQHEITHIREKHTWDKLFLQSVQCLFWINPFFWLLQRELYLIHEFIADKKAVRDNDTSAFAAMLLHAQFGPFRFSPAQPFFYSPIKRRLLMLTTSKDARYSYTRRVMVLPLLAVTCTLFAVRIQAQQKAAATSDPASEKFFVAVPDASHPKELYVLDKKMTVTTVQGDTILPGKPATTTYELGGMADTPVKELTVVGYKVGKTRNLEDTTGGRFGTYQGQRVKDVFTNADQNKVLLKLEDGSTETITREQAMENGVKMPGKIRMGSALVFQSDSTRNGARVFNAPLVATAGGKALVPLYVLDGTIISAELMSAIKPGDIQSISVLKGESAIAAYGEKGKNGVVLIESKAVHASGIAPKTK